MLSLWTGEPRKPAFDDASPEGHYLQFCEDGAPIAITIVNALYIFENEGRITITLPEHRIEATDLGDHREIGEKVWERFNAGSDEILWHYRSLAEVFARRRPRRMADKLVESVDELERLAKRKAQRRRAYRDTPTRSAR